MPPRNPAPGATILSDASEYYHTFARVFNLGINSTTTSIILVLIRERSGGRVTATEAVDSGLIPGRVKRKTIKIGIHSFPA